MCQIISDPNSEQIKISICSIRDSPYLFADLVFEYMVLMVTRYVLQSSLFRVKQLVGNRSLQRIETSVVSKGGHVTCRTTEMMLHSDQTQSPWIDFRCKKVVFLWVCIVFQVICCKFMSARVYTERAGAWSTWTGWGSCSESCDQGQQSRSRSCVSINDSDVMADDCVGDATMTRTCNDFECPGACPCMPWLYIVIR